MKSLRTNILKVSSESGEGHVPSALSILDIIFVLYNEFIGSTKDSSVAARENRFILSKGHASLALYAVLHHFGKLSEEDLYSFAKFESKLGGHPDRNKIQEVECSSGSLGHGLPQGVGLAMALRITESAGHVYVLIGDGEANEGTIWESALLASNHDLENLTCIVDNNQSSVRAVDMGKLADKFAAFGWKTIEVNGHDHEAIRQALVAREAGKPVAIIAHTIKGYGILSMESNPSWHHRSPTSEELTQLLGEIR
jgi:transketolase